MSQHRHFVCAYCERKISGCPKSCPEPNHIIEKVYSCAVCAQGGGSEKVREGKRKPHVDALPLPKVGSANRVVETDDDPVSVTDVAERKGLKKLATETEPLW